MRIAILYHTGLFTSVTGAMCGAATHLSELRQDLVATGHDVNLMVVAWNDTPAPYVLGRLVGSMRADDPYHGRELAACPYDFVVVIGHSHGSDRANTSAGALPGRYDKPNEGGTVDVVCLIDDCPFLDPAAHAISRLVPRTPPVAAVRGCAFWQANEQPSGQTYAERKGWISVDVSKWESGNIGHAGQVGSHRVSIAGHGGVWAQIQSVVFAGVAAKMLGE